jgi:hypothetical protein
MSPLALALSPNFVIAAARRKYKGHGVRPAWVDKRQRIIPYVAVEIPTLRIRRIRDKVPNGSGLVNLPSADDM